MLLLHCLHRIVLQEMFGLMVILKEMEQECRVTTEHLQIDTKTIITVLTEIEILTQEKVEQEPTEALAHQRLLTVN